MGTVPDLDLAKIRRYCKDKTPPELRDQIRLEVTVRRTSVTMFDCRPPWSEDLTEWSRMPIGQLRYDASANRWTLYWSDRNSRWHLYDLIAPGSVEELLTEIDKDPTCIFWG